MCLAPPQENRQAWSEEDWLRESEERTKDYLAHGPRGPVTWILVEGRDIPDRAIFTGEERGQHVYTCRAWHEVSPSVDAACLFAKGCELIWFGRQGSLRRSRSCRSTLLFSP